MWTEVYSPRKPLWVEADSSCAVGSGCTNRTREFVLTAAAGVLHHLFNEESRSCSTKYKTKLISNFMFFFQIYFIHWAYLAFSAVLDVAGGFLVASHQVAEAYRDPAYPAVAYPVLPAAFLPVPSYPSDLGPWDPCLVAQPTGDHNAPTKTEK